MRWTEEEVVSPSCSSSSWRCGIRVKPKIAFTPGPETFRWGGGTPPGPPRTRFFQKVSGKKLTNNPFPKTERFSPKTAVFAQKTPFLGQFLMDFS